MLKFLEIINFEGYKKVTLDFSKKSNSIIGKNDRGKSTIVRAIRWLISNQPLKATYIPKFWGKPSDITSVKIGTYEGDVVERRKSSKINEYVLNGEVFTGFNKEVPERIQRVLNMNDINCQFQFDPPFLLLGSHGEISRYLNKIVNLDVINTTQANADKKQKEIEKEIKSKERDKNLYEESLFEFENLEELESIVERAESLQFKIDKKQKLVNTVQDLCFKKQELEEQIQNNEQIIKNKTLLGKTIGIHQAVFHLEKKNSSLCILKNTKNRYVKKFKKAKIVLKNKKLVDRLESLGNEFLKINKEAEKLKTLKQKKESYIKNIKNRKEYIIKYKQEYKKAFPNGICPLCNSKII